MNWITAHPKHTIAALETIALEREYVQQRKQRQLVAMPPAYLPDKGDWQ